jgi:hypothetical protein
MRSSKVIAKLLSAALAVGICGIADAKTSTTSKKAGIHGIIESVQAGKSQITVKIGSAKKGTLTTAKIAIGSNTAIQLKSKATGSFKDLHAGDRIIIEPDTTNPTTIVDMGGRQRHARLVK